VGRERATVYLDSNVLRAARVMAARTGKRDSDVVEDALRRYLGINVLDEIWSASRADLSGDEALALANRELHDTRAGR
jgi:hypothetical protein